MNKHFDLRFEGPKDDSPATLRQIKGVFVADLEFPASDVLHFIESAPVVIKSAASQEELLKDYKLLIHAGAKVLIVQREQDNDSCLDLEFESVLPARETELVPHFTEGTNAIELSTETESEDPVSSADSAGSEADARSYDIDSKNNSLFDLSLELETEPAIAATEKKEPESGQEFVTAGPELSLESSRDPVPTPEEPSIRTEAGSSPDSELEIFTPEGSTLFLTESAEPPPPAKTLQAAESKLSQPDLTEEISSTNKTTAAGPASQNRDDHSSGLDHDPRIELTLEELKALQKPKSHARTAKPLLLLLLILLAAPVLYLLNSAFFSASKDKNPFDSLLQSLPQIVEAPDPLKQKQLLDQKSAEIQQAIWHTTEKIFSDRTYKVSIWTEKQNPVHGSLELSTPKPAALTKEEIVSKVPPRTWFKRLEIKDLMFKKEGESWLAAGPAFAYLSKGDRNFRVAGKATFRAVFSSNGAIELTVQSSSEVLDGEQLAIQQEPQLQFRTSADSASEKDFFYFAEKS